MDDAGMCNICKEVYTQSYVEIFPDIYIHVCLDCIELTKENFIWLCITCGKAYIRPKALVINKVKDLELKKAYMLCEDMQTIQGIDMCIACDPERILDYMEIQHAGLDC